MNWNELLMGKEEFSFLVEVIVRTSIIFLFLIVMLRLTGKRGVKQLSIFEMVMIIALGSSAGDPMLYKDVGLLPAILVFAIILGIYRGIIYIITRSEKWEKTFEGKTKYIVEDGVNTTNSKYNYAFASDEFFAELRTQNVEHLGQIKRAILETSGEISILFFPDEEVRPGLPIWPEYYNNKNKEVKQEGLYACSNCGTVEILRSEQTLNCTKCDNDQWVRTQDTKRIA